MGSPSSFLFAAAVMFLTGMGIPVMAALNGGLGRGLQSPVAATMVLFGLGFALAAGVLAVTVLKGQPPAWRGAATVPWYAWCGAFLVVAYIIAITFFGPRIGIGNAVFFVLLGQLVAAAAIDHWGLFGAIRQGLTVQRAAGIAVMAVGVWLAKKPR